MSERASAMSRKHLIIAGVVIGLILLVVASCTLLSPVESQSENASKNDTFIVPPDDVDGEDEDTATASPRDPSDTSADEGERGGDADQPGTDYSAAGDPDSYAESADDNPYIPDPERSRGDDEEPEEPVDVPSQSPNPIVDDQRPDPGEDGRNDDTPGGDNGEDTPGGDEPPSGDDGGDDNDGGGDDGPGDDDGGDGPGDDSPDDPGFPPVDPGDVLSALNDIRSQRALDPFTGSQPSPQEDYELWRTDPLLSSLYRSRFIVTDGDPADELAELVKTARDAQHLLRSDLPIGAVPVLGVETREVRRGIEVTLSYAVHNTVAPEAEDDDVTVTYDPQAIEPTVIDVLANDRIIASSTDVREALSITIKPLQGTVELSGGAIVYTPPANPVTARDVLHYTVTDLQGRTSSASVTITLEIADPGDEGDGEEPSPPAPSEEPSPEPTRARSDSPAPQPATGGTGSASLGES